MKPVYLQLYSVREACGRDLEGTLRLVKEMGYEGVETAGLHGLKPKEFRRLLDDIGLKCQSGHFGVGGDVIAKSIEEAKALGIEFLVAGFGPDAYGSEAAVKDSIAKLAAANDAVRAAGLKFLMHNHWWEFEKADGQVIFDAIRERIPSLEFELDCYWCANFGKYDPAEILRRNAARVPIIHIKDGSFEKGKVFCALGEGRAKIGELLKAGDYQGLKFVTVEIDNCEGDMLETLRRSFVYIDKLRKEI